MHVLTSQKQVPKKRNIKKPKSLFSCQEKFELLSARKREQLRRFSKTLVNQETVNSETNVKIIKQN